jgi:alanine racemase
VARRLNLRPEARVDLARLADNYRAVASHAGRPVIAVVKAAAYGHGAAPVARALEAAGAAMLAVASAEEGQALRVAGVRSPILVFGGSPLGQERLIVERALTPVVSGALGCEGALAAGRLAPVSVHVEVDTGMARLGFGPDQAVAVARRLAEAGVTIEGVMTQLSSADEDKGETERQLDRFDAVLADLARHGIQPSFAHAANSAGLAFQRPTHTAVRPGLLLYGLRTRPLGPNLEVRPVMSVTAPVLQVREIAAGTRVSYGGRWRASRPSRVAAIGFGYADGLPRTATASTRGFVLLHGRRAPIAGNVCMDLTVVDVTDIPVVVEGDEAIVLGESPTAWDLGDWAGTNAWQVLTAIGPRVIRTYAGTDNHRDTEAQRE